MTDLFEPLNHLPEAEMRYVRASRAPNTIRAYATDVSLWGEWCSARGVEPLPASPGQLGAYVAAMADNGLKWGTIERRMAAIRFQHRAAGLADPTDDPGVKAVLAGISRSISTRPEGAPPLMPPDLFEVVDALPGSLAGLRDRALLLVGFYGAFRRSELVGLTVDDVRQEARGVVVSIQASKTNQRGQKAEQVVLPAGGEYCPVAALAAWTNEAGIADGPLFRPVTRGGVVRPVAITAQVVTLVVARATAAVPHLAEAGFTAHSLRSGFATYAHHLGIEDEEIAKQTRHGTAAGVDAYIRERDPWRSNAATRLVASVNPSFTEVTK